MDKVSEQDLINRLKRSSHQSKIEVSQVYEEIKRIYTEFRADIQDGRVNMKQLYRAHIAPIIPVGEDISYQNFLLWSKGFEKKTEQVHVGRSLVDREMEKTKKQFEIRQDATDLMSSFLKTVKLLADDPDALKKANIKPLDLYKIIREEEDRAKSLRLKERAENRADAAFAFMVSVSRAGMVEDADIEFLEDSIKQELMSFKHSHGIYKLPTGENMAEVPAPAEVDFAVANESNTQGFI